MVIAHMLRVTAGQIGAERIVGRLGLRVCRHVSAPPRQAAGATQQRARSAARSRRDSGSRAHLTRIAFPYTALPIRRASHVRIIGPAAALRHDPIDVLLRILDVAGFAVDAILRVDLQPRLAARRLAARSRRRPAGQ